MEDRNHYPSRLVSLNDTVDYGRQRSETTIATTGTMYHQHQQQLVMLPQPPPLLIHTVPSYVSNRSISNRSVSNRSVSNRSVSNRSVATSTTRGRHHPNATTQEAEVIAIATNQARAAAQSILLTGGSQAAALSTAKAAAKSVLLPEKEGGGGKPPLGSTRNKNFRNRRKNRQQAEIIASMALISVNEALSYGTMGNDMMTLTPGGMRSVYPDERSEFHDDYTSYRSLGPVSIHGRSNSGRSHKELQLLQYPEYYEQSLKPDKQIVQQTRALENSTQPAITRAIQGQSTTADQATIESKAIKSNIGLLSDKPQSSTNPSPNNVIQGKREPVDVQATTLPESKEVLPKMRIPTEMPMPKSSSIKAIAPLKGSNSGKQNAKMDRNGTPRSRQQLSESQISCYSDHSSVSHTNSYSYAGSTYDEHTADYTRGTFESAVDSTTRRKSSFGNRNRFSSGASFFSTMDPFVRTFSEVFSCNPGVPVHDVPKNYSQSDMIHRLKQRESRDASAISPSNNNPLKDEARDQPTSQLPLTAMAKEQRAAPRRSISVEESTLSVHDIQSLDDRAETRMQQEPSVNKKRMVVSPTMEQLVLRALSAMSPKGSGSRRPKLNLKPSKQTVEPAPIATNSHSSTKYRSLNDVTGNIRMNDSINSKKVGMDKLNMPILPRTTKKSNRDGSFSYNDGTYPSMESTSSGVQHPQQKHHSKQSGSSSSGDYYVSNTNSTDDSVNVPPAHALPAPTTIKVDNVVEVRNNRSKNSHRNKSKRFSSFFTKKILRDDAE